MFEKKKEKRKENKKILIDDCVVRRFERNAVEKSSGKISSRLCYRRLVVVAVVGEDARASFCACAPAPRFKDSLKSIQRHKGGKKGKKMNERRIEKSERVGKGGWGRRKKKKETIFST